MVGETVQDCSILTEVRALLGSYPNNSTKNQTQNDSCRQEYTLFSKPMLLPPKYMKEKRRKCNAILTAGKGEV